MHLHKLFSVLSDPVRKASVMHGALRNVDRYMGAPMKCLTNHGCSFEISIDKWVLLWNVYQIHWCSFLNVYTSIHRKSKPQNIYSLYVMYTHGGCMYVWDPWGLYYRVAHFFLLIPNISAWYWVEHRKLPCCPIKFLCQWREGNRFSSAKKQ